MLSKLLILSSLLIGTISTAADDRRLTTIEILNQSETYLGSVAFQGGVLSNGELVLQQPTEIQSIRFEIPGFCQTRILEAGTVTEGVADLAQRTSNPNVYLVNGGRGTRARSVFVSLQGPQNITCNVLVYGTTNTTVPGPTPPPIGNPDSLRAVACITNQSAGSFAGNVSTDGQYQEDFSIPAGKTTMFITTLRPDRSVPVVQISYDADVTTGYYVMQTSLSSMVQSYPDCRSATNYVVRQRYGSNYLEVVRY